MTLIQAYTAAAAERDPDATAIVLGDERLSYGDLVTSARRLGHLLRELGVHEGERVALMTPKTPEAIVAMHAVLEAGGAYVPIDLASPPTRAAHMIRASQPRAILAAPAAGPLLDELAADGAPTGIDLVSLERGWTGSERAPAGHGPADWAGRPDEPLPSTAGSDSLAHILFTSGSTGVPKGVQITHAMVAAFVEWAVDHFETTAGEAISGHPPLHFDLSTFDVYATLKAGAELHLVPASANLSPAALASFIREGRLAQWFSVPSTLAFMVRSGVVEQNDFPSLRRVLFCGEAMPAPVLAEWMRRVPQASYTNLYGPTETTIASSYYDVPGIPEDETESLPIGVPCPGEKIMVLDERRRPLPAGEIGELHIGGVGLSPGYWRDPEKTASAFVQGPGDAGRIYATGDLGWAQPDGLLRYVGRVDSQIKHRGYRIELGEIEAALDSLEELRESAVVAIETPGFEGTAICCAYVPAQEAAAPVGLRSALRGTLPSYMIPTEWMAYEALPKNANGKIDRRVLREAFTAVAKEAGSG